MNTTLNQVRILDTTLRDGTQAAGAQLKAVQALIVAQKLARLDVDVIEAGFPIASPEIAGIVARIAHEVKGPIIAALARCKKSDIDAAVKALAEAPKPRIHVFIGTSKIHREEKLKMSPEEIIAAVRQFVAYARSHVQDVQFSAEDASRTELEFLTEVVMAAIEAGATTINIPDTVGWSQPEEYGKIFAHLRSAIPAIAVGKVILSCHCHDDLGNATANTLAAIRNGARQAECTVNGLGERAGNAPLEEVIMNLSVRRDIYQVFTAAEEQADQLAELSRLIALSTGFIVPPNKAIVGRNAFAHASGIHQDGILKHRGTYEIMDPRSVGALGTEIVLSKQSGRKGLRHRLKDRLGLTLQNDELELAYSRFLEVAANKSVVTDEDLQAIVGSAAQPDAGPWKLNYFRILSEGGITPIPSGLGKALAQVVLQHTDGTSKTGIACAAGPIDAGIGAILNALGIEGLIAEHYVAQSVSAGKDAQGEASLTVTRNGESEVGKGVSPNTTEAAMAAFLEGANRLITRQPGLAAAA